MAGGEGIGELRSIAGGSSFVTYDSQRQTRTQPGQEQNTKPCTNLQLYCACAELRGYRKGGGAIIKS